MSFGDQLPPGVDPGAASTSSVRIIDVSSQGGTPPLQVNFGKSVYPVPEDDTVTVTVTLSAAPGSDVTIPITKTEKGGATTTDYSGVPDVVEFGATDTEKSFVFTATDDTDDDDGESVELGFGDLPGGLQPGTIATTSVAIADDDAPESVVVRFESDVYTVMEGATTSIQVILSEDSEREVTVPITWTDLGGATSTDYSVVPASVTFTSGDTEKEIVFTANADGIDDSGESVRLTIASSLPAGVDRGMPYEATVSIANSDMAGLVLSESSLTVVEGATTGRSYTVKLSTQPTGPVTVAVSGHEGTALRLSTTTLSFSTQGWNTPQTVEVTAVDDANAVDESETLTHTASGGEYGGVSAGLSVTVTDDDTPGLVLSTSTLSVVEGEPVGASYTVRLSHEPTGPVTVEISGHSGTDLVLSATSLSFATSTWNTPQTVSITAVDDANAVDESETLTHTASGGEYSGVSVDLGVTVLDDAPDSVTVSFGKSQYVVDEGATTSIEVVLSAEPERTVDIELVGTGRNGAMSSDYAIAPTRGRFAAGETRKTFVFTAHQDTDDDDGESVRLTFGQLPVGVSGGATTTATVSIADDDDPRVSVSFGQSTYTVSEGSTTTVSVILSADPERSVTIDLVKTNLDGATDSDYSGVPQSLTFSREVTERSFVFTAARDLIGDGGESVELSFGDQLPPGVDPGAASTSSVRIIDVSSQGGTPSPQVSFGSSKYPVPEGATATVTVTLSAAPGSDVTIPITKTEKGGATTTDYSGVPDVVEFGATDTEKSFVFTATDDTDDDDGESVELGFGDLPGGLQPGTIATTSVEIADDDAPETVEVSFEEPQYTVAEGATTTVTVTLSAGPERVITIDVVVAGENGASSTDFTLHPATVTFNSGEISKTLVFTATQDSDNDDDESVRLTFGTLPPMVSGGTTTEATVDIDDDDYPAVVVRFESDVYTVMEGATTSIQVIPSEDPEREVTVSITRTDLGGATSTDYSGVPADVTFSSGETEEEIVFTANADGIDDGGESVRLTIASSLPAGVDRGMPYEATVSIANSDMAGLVLSESSLTVVEGATTGRSYTVKLSTQPTGPVTVAVSGHEGTALRLSTTTLSFSTQGWNTPQTVEVTAVDDANAVDESETLTHTASGGEYGGVSAGLSVTVTDDDTPGLVLSTSTLSVVEGDAVGASYTVSLSHEPTETVTVEISGHGGTDLRLSATTLSYSPDTWNTPQTVGVTAVDDADPDDDPETLTHTASGGEYGGVSVDLGVTVTDDAPESVTVSFERDTYTVMEGSTVTVTVIMSEDPEREVTVSITRTDLNGATSTDYSVVPASVTFTSGDTEKEIVFTANADGIDDSGESVRLTIASSLPSGVDRGTPYEATVSIANSDKAGLVLSESSLTVVEGATTGRSYTVRLSTQPTQSVTVEVSGHEGTALRLSTTTLSFSTQGWNTPQTVEVTAVDDSNAVDESETLTHTASGGEYAGVSTGLAVTVTDDAPVSVSVSFERSSYTVDEGATTSIQVILSEDPEREVTVSITMTDLGGATSTDYSGVPASVIFPIGQTSKSFIFTATQDSEDEDNESVLLAFGTLPPAVSPGTNAQATVSINDDDDPMVTVSFEQASYRVSEGDMVTFELPST